VEQLRLQRSVRCDADDIAVEWNAIAITSLAASRIALSDEARGELIASRNAEGS
jgi:hypothetical protein